MLKFTLSLAILVLVALTLAVAASGEDGLLRFKLKQWSRTRPAIDQSGGKAILPMTRHGLYEFYIPIKVGTPAQELRVTFKAHESDIWLLSTDCKTKYCRGHRKYDHKLSSTYKPNGTKTIADDDDYSGYLSYDDLSLGALVIKKCKFGEVVDASDNYRSYDGVFGISPHVKSDWSDSDHIMYKMIKDGIVKEPKLSIYFKQFGLKESDEESGGEMVFGGVDESHFRGNISYVKNHYDKYVKSWNMDISGVSTYSSTENKEVNVCPDGCKMLIADFNLLTYGPATQVGALNKGLGAKPLRDSGYHYFDDCTTANKPNVTFTVGGQNLVMRPEHYLMEIAYKNKTVCISSFKASAFSDWPWALGTKFMTAFYLVFDYGEQQVGFAETK